MNISDLNTTLLLSTVGVGYLLAVPFSTYCADQHKFIIIPISGAFLSLVLIILGTIVNMGPLDQHIASYLVVLSAAGAAATGCIAPVYSLLYFESQLCNEPPSETTISGIVNAQFALGGTLGPVFFGGILYEVIHFHICGFLLGIFLVIATLVTAISMENHGLLKNPCECPKHKKEASEQTKLVKNESSN